MTALNGWHPGERSIHSKMGLDKVPNLSAAYRYIQGEMPDQHSRFHSSNLHFLPLVTLDKTNRPWTSVLAGKDGEIGWIERKGYTTLRLNAKVWGGDPFWENSRRFDEEKARSGDDGYILAAGIGVEVSTRRRNKLAGKVVKLERKDEEGTVQMDLDVNEACGNCPKYIVLRSVHGHASTNPTISNENLYLSPRERLPPDIVAFVLAADTVWLGSAYLPNPSDPLYQTYPPHLGANHRGGRPGFVRIKPSDGRTLVLPDFSGNRFMTSLGNIEHTPSASLTIVDFQTGDILYLTGDATNLVGKDAESLMPLQGALTTIYVTGYVFVKDAVPVRQKPLKPGELEVEISPYSPPIKLLKEELELQGRTVFDSGVDGEVPTATMRRVEILAPDIATFTFTASVPLSIKPGQYIILDWRSFLGERQYRHMNGAKPTLVNDDFIRTWTVSSALHLTTSTGTTEFEITMREKPGGIVTGALFSVANKLKEGKPEMMRDMSALEIRPKIVGVAGDFFLDVSEADITLKGTRKLLWAASGIGITPFLSMLHAIAASASADEMVWDIVFLLSTREPEVLVRLVDEAYRSGSTSDSKPTKSVRLQLHVFTGSSGSIRTSTSTTALTSTILSSPSTGPTLPPSPPSGQNGFPLLSIHTHPGRIMAAWFGGAVDLKEREPYVCGPERYEKMVVDALVNIVGLERGKVRQEEFTF